MGHHHDRLVEGLHRSPEEAEQLGARAGVEVARGLVGEDDLRAGHECPGDGDPLLLAPGQLGRAVREAIPEPHLRNHRVEPIPVRPLARQQQRQGDVLRGGQRGQQVVGLEDEAHPLPPQQRQFGVRERSQLDVAEKDLAGGELVEAGQAVHERGLARPRRPHDGGEASLGKPHGHLVEGAHGGVGRAVDLGGVDGSCRCHGERLHGTSSFVVGFVVGFVVAVIGGGLMLGAGRRAVVPPLAISPYGGLSTAPALPTPRDVVGRTPGGR